MYELNRVRLHNIGPTGARYGDVLLDLSGGGPPIPAGTLLPLPGQLYRRPALATLLVMENGGGKSVLVRMLLSTVLPDRQSRRSREALRAYLVSAASPSHVALEWVNVRTGETLLTCQALSPAADGRAERLFYSLIPNSATNLATLPFAEDQRRLPMNAFHDALRRLDAADKSLRVEVEKRQGEWENHLRRLGLEPDLFAVQQAMNVDEGDAAEAFKTTTGRQFVEWLLSKALDAENFAELGKAYGNYAKNIGRREQQLLDRDFSTATAAAAERLASRHADQVAAATAAQTAGTALAQLAAEVQESVQCSEQVLCDHRDDLATAKMNAGQRQQIRDEADLVCKEVRRRTLGLRCDEARARAKEIEERLVSERAELAAWVLVPKVLGAAAAREKYQVASDLLDAAEQAAGAARQRRDHAGARLASALQNSRQQCINQANGLAGKSKKVKADALEAERSAREDERHATANTVQAELLANHVKTVESDVERAREQCILEEAEAVPYANARLRHKAVDSEAQVTRERAAHTELGLEARRLELAANQLIEPEVTARLAAEAAVKAVRDMDSAAQALAAATLVRELAELDGDEDVPGGDPALWLEANASALRDLAAAAQGTAEDRLDGLNADNRADQRLIDALTVEDDALLPPREAVEHLLELLADRGIAATAGWRALEQLVNPRRHAEVIQANPALMDGVVVADQAALDTARQVLAEARPLPAAAVLITTAESLEYMPAEWGSGFVVEPTPAMHDPAAAVELRRQAEKRMADRNGTIRELTRRRTAAFQLGTWLDTWFHDHPAGDTERLRSVAETTSHVAAGARSALVAARDVHTQALDSVDRHAIVVADAEEAAAAATRDAESMGRIAADVAKADEERVQIAALEAEAEGHHEAAQEFRDNAERLRNRATEYAVQAESFRRDAASYAARLKKVVFGNQPLSTDTEELDLAALEITYQEAADGFRAVEVGEDLRRRVDDAQREASALDTELLGEPAYIRAQAEALAVASEAGSTEALEAHGSTVGLTPPSNQSDSCAGWSDSSPHPADAYSIRSPAPAPRAEAFIPTGHRREETKCGR